MKKKFLIILILLLLIITSIGFAYLIKEQATLISNIAILNSEKEQLQNKVNELEDQFGEEETPDEATTILPETVILNIPGYKQKHNASCEFAATSSILKYFGKSFTEEQIHEAIGVDNSPRFFDEQGNLHWGNPQEKYVGDIDGRIVYVDGYGVYNKPIYKFLEKNGFSKSISKTQWELEELLTYIRKGYPAIVWISNDYKEKEIIKMIASDGTENPSIDKEHTVVIRGVDKENIYVMDVGYGTQYTVSYSKFLTGFKNLDNMGIVVIPD